MLDFHCVAIHRDTLMKPQLRLIFLHIKQYSFLINKSDSLTEILKLLSIINHTKYEIDHTNRKVNVFKD